MQNLEVKTLEASDLAAVQGGKGSARTAAVNPFDPFGVGAAWMNAASAWMTYAPPFSTTPIFPTPFY